MSLTAVPPVACFGEPRLTAGFDEFGRLDLTAHEMVHGAVNPLSPKGLLRLVEGIELKGKGAPASRSPASSGRCWSRRTGRTCRPWWW
ncbi:hypothetical protein GCM10027615_52280 [Plantactinospora veratri]